MYLLYALTRLHDTKTVTLKSLFLCNSFKALLISSAIDIILSDTIFLLLFVSTENTTTMSLPILRAEENIDENFDESLEQAKNDSHFNTLNKISINKAAFDNPLTLRIKDINDSNNLESSKCLSFIEAIYLALLTHACGLTFTKLGFASFEYR